MELQRVLQNAWSLAQGNASLQVVVVSSVVLFAIVVCLAGYMLGFRAYHRLRREYRERRAALYRPAIELVLMEEPYQTVLAALRPRRASDSEIAQEVAIESMRHLEGAPFETLSRACGDLRWVDDDLRALRERGRRRRGRAIDALGVMRAKRAIPELVAALGREDLELRLVVLRALAAIGDPAALPALVDESDRLPRPLLPRLVSLVFEFGSEGRAAAAEIVNRHPRDFPPGAVKDILTQFAAELETP